MGTSLYEQYQAQQAAPQSGPGGPSPLYQQYLASRPQPPSLLSRAGSMVGGAISQAVHHPILTAESLVEAPVRSFMTALAPSQAELDADAQPGSIAHAAAFARTGDAPGMQDVSAAHPVTERQRLVGTAQTVANEAFPGITDLVSGRLASAGIRAGLAKTVGTSVAGGLAGAAYNPNDMGAGALAGGVLAPLTTVAGHGLGAVGRGVAGAGKATMDMAAPTLTNTGEHAAQVNSRMLAPNGAQAADGLPATSPRPVTPMDIAGTAGVRAARGLKSSNPVAESIIRPALQARADDAVNRVIQHGLDAAGLSSRDSGVQLVQDMVQQRSQEADQVWPQIFQNHPEAISDDRIAKIWNTASGQQAWKEVPSLMSDRFLEPPQTVSVPQGFSPEQWQQIRDAAIKAGVNVPGTSDGSGPPPMNLQQLHYWAKALDDLGDRYADRGPGQPGNKYNKSIGAQRLAGMVRDVAKENVSDYAAASQQYADASQLVRGAELGRELFKMHPDEAAQAVAQLPDAAQQVFRRSGFDALAERIENGPADVERGVGKTRDVKRMRLLFPSDEAFDDFRTGLAEEGQMHANEQAVLNNSSTADKLADMANMAGVTLPDVARAVATGRIHRLMGKAAAGLTQKMMGAHADALAAERARLLVAGANGDQAARTGALQSMRLGHMGPNTDGSTFADALRRSAGLYPRQALLTAPSQSSGASGGP